METRTSEKKILRQGYLEWMNEFKRVNSKFYSNAYHIYKDGSRYWKSLNKREKLTWVSIQGTKRKIAFAEKCLAKKTVRLPNGYRKCLTDILDDGATHEDVPRHPSELLVDFLYLASQADARDPATLKRYGITHVVNCVGSSTSRRNPYKAGTGVIKYYQFSSDDCPSYPMIAQHFDPVRNFLDEAYESGGRALVHCKAGVNRSATLCVAYMMLKKNMTLLKAVTVAKRKRVYVLSNRGFRQQLIDFAKNNDLVIEKNRKSNRNRHARNSY